MKKRIFIGLTISKHLNDLISDWQKSHQYLDVKWIKAENIHITIIPPWYEKPTNIGLVSKIIEDSIKHFGHFDLSFYNIKLGSAIKYPRLIWAVGEQNECLINIKNKLHKQLSIEQSKKPFIPHITLAKFKEKVDLDTTTIHWIEHVEKITLFESTLNEECANYISLEKFKLK